mmetsp:Transcript_8431/g.26428  ORF Transcript_8431/g.26428 Transcript_8431/m.26428 type:complete len:212 (-) Transcript_8431:184-819(-)
MVRLAALRLAVERVQPRGCRDSCGRAVRGARAEARGEDARLNLARPWDGRRRAADHRQTGAVEARVVAPLGRRWSPAQCLLAHGRRPWSLASALIAGVGRLSRLGRGDRFVMVCHVLTAALGVCERGLRDREPIALSQRAVTDASSRQEGDGDVDGGDGDVVAPMGSLRSWAKSNYARRQSEREAALVSALARPSRPPPKAPQPANVDLEG